MKIILLLPILILSACAPSTKITTLVSSYSLLSDTEDNYVIHVIPIDDEIDTSDIKWKSNVQILNNLLLEKGYKLTDDIHQSDIVLGFDYQVISPTYKEYEVSVPNYGITGYSGSTTTATINNGFLKSNTALRPIYGVQGYSDVKRVDNNFTRLVSLKAWNKNSVDIVFESKGVSTGTCGLFPVVGPKILEAVLINFPKGHNGSVSLPTDINC